MSLTITVQGSAIAFLEGTLHIDEQVDNRSVCSFSLVDASGNAHYQKGQPVVITDGVLGTLFAGFVYDVTETKLYPGTGIRHDFAVVDNVYIADKRVASKSYTNQYAGDIASDIFKTYLSSEGVTSAYALDVDSTQSDFAAGTLSGTTATTNIGDGDLELALSGSTVTITETTTSDFSSGTLSNVVANSNSLQLVSYNGIQMSGTCVGNVGNAQVYWMLYPTNTSQPNDWLLEYNMWIDGSSAEIKAGIDVVYTDGTRLRDYRGGIGNTDQIGFGSNPSTDLKNWADNKWYYRRIGLYPFTGKTIDYIAFGFESDNPGFFNAYLHDVKITYNGSTMIDVSAAFGSTTFGWQISNNGYSNMNVQYNFPVYEKTGTRTSNAYSLSSVGNYQNSLITWNEVSSDTTQVTIETSIDNGATWQSILNHSALHDFIAGASLSGKSVKLLETLSIIGNVPTITPALSNITFSVFPAYAATKTDVMYSRTSQSDFNAGTLTNTLAQSAGTLTLNGYWKNWTDGSIFGQNLYGNGSPSQGIYANELLLTTNTNADVRSSLTSPGQWQNFTAQVIVQIPTSGSGNIGLVYRTTGWQNNDNTFAYAAYFDTTHITLARGTNSTSGSGSLTTIATASIALTAFNFYTLKIVINGSNHKVYLDDILYINATDSTYSAAGYIGCRMYNNTGGNLSGFFGSFAVVAQLSGTYVSENLSLNSVGTAGTSKIFWNDSVPSGSSNLVETSLDGGSTWQTASNGGQISGITNGTNLAGKNLKVRSTLTAGTTDSQVVLSGYTAWVTSQYTSTGTRVSPSLSLDSVGRAGSTLVSWANQSLPSGCTIGVDVSPDTINWTDVTSGNGGSIPIITSQPIPTIDTFNTNTSSNYTNTHYGSGANGTWTYSTANSKVTATTTNNTDGDNALFIYNGLSYQDGFIEYDTDMADSSGIVLQYLSATSSMYLLKIQDASATSGAPNTVGLYKRISSTAQLGSNVSISFTRGTVHRFRLDLQSGILTVSMDGVQIFQYNDTGGPPLLGAGNFALRAGKTGNFYSVRMQGYGDKVGAPYYEAIVLGDSPFAYYRLNETSGTAIHDDTANAYTGTLTGTGTTLGTAPLIYGDQNKSITFSGNSYVDLPLTGFPTGANPWTIELWCKFSTLPGSGGFYCMAGFGTRSSAQSARIQIHNTSGTTQFQLSTFGTDLTGGTVSTNTTYHIIGTYDGTQARLYVNGALIVGPTTISMNIVSGFACLGANGTGGAFDKMVGILDEAIFYNTALSQTQVYNHYISGTSKVKVLYSRVRLGSTNPLATPQLTNLSLSVHDPTINNGVLMPTFNTNTYVSEAINSLATNSNYLWTIDENKRPIFHDRSVVGSPFPITSSDIEVATAKVMNSADLYRNQQTVIGGTDTQSFTTTIMGNGLTQSFTMPYPFYSSPTVTVNGYTQSLGKKGVDTGKDFYYAVGDGVLIQDSSETPLSSNDTLVVVGIGIIPVTVTVTNAAGVTERQGVEGGSGIIENIYDASSQGLNKTAATQLANSLLSRYGTIGRTITFTTRRTGLAIGQYATIFLPEHGIIDASCLITKLTTTVRTLSGSSYDHYYSVEATEGPNLTNWARAITGK